MASYPGAFDEAVFDRSAFDTESVIWIETTDPSGRFENPGEVHRPNAAE